MVETLDKIYSKIEGKSRVKSFKRFAIRLIANLLLPVYFRIRRRVGSELSRKKREKLVIVSLTTFPKRISRVWLVIECLLRQTYRPDKIQLYLSTQQFPKLRSELPKTLLRYENNGQLEVVFVDDDLRSHKKYFYAFHDYPDDYIILVDDDIFYVKTLISELLELHDMHPNAICCHRGYKVLKDASGNIKKYNEWQKLKSFRAPKADTFHTSGGGTLYIPSMLGNDVLDKGVFKEICFMADDIWLNFHAQINQIRTVKSHYYSECIPVLTFRQTSLKTYNVSQGGNDQQLRDLIDHYDIKAGQIF